MKKKNIFIILIIIICIGVVVTGGIAAYLTDSDSKKNVFTAGSVKISLTEPSWDESSAVELKAGDKIGKDPTITNIGKSDAVVYIKVEEPVVHLMDGYSEPLFLYDVSDNNWFLLRTEECYNPPKVTSIYIYLRTLGKNQSTPSLFDEVEINNFNQVDANGYKDMKITGYAIQVRNVVDENATPETVFDTYFNDGDSTCTGTPPENSIYRWSESEWAGDQNISSFTNGTHYVTDKALLINMDPMASHYYLRHTIDNGKVVDNYVCFVLNDSMKQNHPEINVGEYCLKRGGSRTNEYNKKIMTSAFGYNNCANAFSDGYSCRIDNFTVLTSVNYINAFAIDTSGCYINLGGSSNCSYSYPT